MKVNELRVGNFTSMEIKEGVMIDKFVSQEIIYSFDRLIKVEPIPLTEEWLTKFGFVKNGNVFKINVDDCFLWFDIKDKTFCFGVPYEASGTDRKILHVHQLQNLYLALTGEELTIK